MRSFPLIVAGRKTASYNGAAVAFSRHCAQLLRKQGKYGLALYLKKTHVLFTQVLSGTPTAELLATPVRVRCTKDGYPKIIPRPHLVLIRKGCPVTVQFWLSLFSLYRVIECPPKWGLSSIYRKGPLITRYTLEELDFKIGLEDFRKKILRAGRLPSDSLPEWKVDWEAKFSAGPNSATNENGTLTAGKDAVAFLKSGLYPAFSKFCKLTGMDTILDHIDEAGLWVLPEEACQYRWEVTLTKSHQEERKSKGLGAKYYRSADPKNLVFRYVMLLGAVIENAGNLLSQRIASLGRLSLKFEPAGKVRVFALMDYWTQQAFRPLHNWLYRILRKIPQDATFDHDGGVKRVQAMMETYKARHGRYPEVYSYDLSSATDRLPLVVQVEVLAVLLKDEKLAYLWALILVGRFYFLRRHAKDRMPRLPKAGTIVKPALFQYTPAQEVIGPYLEYVLEKERHLRNSPRKLTYSVGQPMGACSSWGMLAVTHHFIVQLAAFRALTKDVESGWKQGMWFKDYMILGDDIVILDDAVAGEYLRIMDRLGVDINLSKSIISSNGSFEFAKQFVWKGVNVTAYTWKEIQVARRTWRAS